MTAVASPGRQGRPRILIPQGPLGQLLPVRSAGFATFPPLPIFAALLTVIPAPASSSPGRPWLSRPGASRPACPEPGSKEQADDEQEHRHLRS